MFYQTLKCVYTPNLFHVIQFCFCQGPCHPWDWMKTGMKGIWVKSASVWPPAGQAWLAGCYRLGWFRPAKQGSISCLLSLLKEANAELRCSVQILA